MLKAVSESIRVSRRRFPRTSAHKNARSQTCSAFHAVELRQDSECRDADRHIQDETPNSRHIFSEAAASPFPFYAHSYTPEASTSKACISAPPSVSIEQQTTKPDNSINRRRRRARRYLAKVAHSIQNIRKLHLSVPGQIEFVEHLLSRLSKIAAEPNVNEPPTLALSQASQLSDVIAHWIRTLPLVSCASHRPTLSGIATSMITLLQSTSFSGERTYANGDPFPNYIQRHSSLQHISRSTPVLAKHADAPTQHTGYQTDTAEAHGATTFLEIIQPALTDAELYYCLSKLSHDDWLQIKPQTTTRLASTLLDNPSAARQIHEAMPARSEYRRPISTVKTHLDDLHRSIFEEHVRSEPGTSRMFGPGPSKESIFHSLKFVLSSTVLALRFAPAEQSFGGQIGQDGALALLQKFRNLFLPPDRHIMAAALHLASFAEPAVREEMESIGIFSWIWQEWNVLRENEPNPMTDDVLLVAFLDVAGMCAGVHHWRLQPVEGTWHTLAPTWASQVVSMAQSKVATSSNLALSSTHYRIQEDALVEINPRIYRSLAVAAINLGQYHRAFTSILDPRLPAKHIVPVLGAFSTHIQGLYSSNNDLYKDLIRASSEHLVLLASRIPKNLSTKHARQLALFIELLILQGHIAAAEAFLNVPTNILAFGHNATHRLFKLLSRGSGTAVLKKLYRRMHQDDWSEHHLRVFLSCRSHWLSDEVWKHVQTRPDSIEKGFLDARLRHHLRSKQLRYSLCLKEVDLLLSNGSKPASEATRMILLDIHIRAGSGHRAMQIYRELYGDGTKNYPGGKVRFLKIAGLPSWSGHRRRGLRSQLSRLGGHLDELMSESAELDPSSALYLAQQSLRWAELNEEAIWSILRSGMSNAKNLNWHRDLKPLFISVKLAFRRRGKYEAAREVVDMMIKYEKQNRTESGGRAI